MRDVWFELRLGARLANKHRSLYATCFLCLLVAFSVNSALLPLVNSAFVRNLPHADASRLAVVWQDNVARGLSRSMVTPSVFDDIVHRSRTFEAVEALETYSANFSVDSDAVHLQQSLVTPGLFGLFGEKPVLGHSFTAADAVPGRDQLVILSHRFFEQQFGGDVRVLGRIVDIHGRPCTIVGVMSATFAYPPSTDLWLPLARVPLSEGDRSAAHSYQVIARLKPGVNVASAQREMDDLARDLRARYPDVESGWSMTVVSFREEQLAGLRTPLLLALVAVAVVVLIAITDVSHLWLVLTESRGHELAVRAALGATRTRLLGQFLIQGVALGLAASTASLIFALAGGRIESAVKADSIRVFGFGLDAGAIAFNLALASIVGALIAIPCATALPKNVARQLREYSGRGGGTAVAGRLLRDCLVVALLALALTLVASAGMLLKSTIKLSHVPTGFTTKNLLTTEISVPMLRYRGQQHRFAAWQGLIEALRGLPGVDLVAATSALPFSERSYPFYFYIEHDPLGSQSYNAEYESVTPGYFRVLGIPVVRGRELSASDGVQLPPAVVINQAMANRFWPNSDPTGKRISVTGPHEGWLSIVGVVGNAKHNSLEEQPSPRIYATYAVDAWPTLTIVLHTPLPRAKLWSQVKRQVLSVDNSLPPFDMKTMEERISESIEGRTSVTVVVTILSVIAVVLAGGGVYGVFALLAVRERKSVAIRMALGATPWDAVMAIARRAAGLVMLGAALGVAGAVAISRIFSSMLYKVSAADPGILMGAAIALAVVAGFATLLPARGVVRQDLCRTLAE